MTQSFSDMIYFFGAGALANEYSPSHAIKIEEIYNLAVQQGVWPVVYLGLKDKYDVATYTPGVLQNVVMNISRNEYIHNIINELESNGIECCYLKGITVSRFYKEPDFRISSDTDILIDENKMKSSKDFLKKNGFDVEENIGRMYHFEARHPMGGILEVHRAFYQEHINDLLFENHLNYNEKYNKVNIGGKTITTLGINDALDHLTAHYIKHFISKGAGVRQLMDLLLYMKNYENEIDWNKYEVTWSKIGFLKLIEKFKGIGVKYWNFSFKTYDVEYIDDILDDIEKGGLFGYGQEERANFMDVFLAEKNKADLEKVEKYMKNDRIKNMKNLIFPNKEKMVKRGYIYASKGGILLFVSWLHRYKDLIFSLFTKRKTLRETVDYKAKSAQNDTEIKRIELMRKLGIFD